MTVYLFGSLPVLFFPSNPPFSSQPSRRAKPCSVASRRYERLNERIIRHGESFPTSALLLEMCSDICGVTEWFLWFQCGRWPGVSRACNQDSPERIWEQQLCHSRDFHTPPPHLQHRLTLPSSGGESVELRKKVHLKACLYYCIDLNLVGRCGIVNKVTAISVTALQTPLNVYIWLY